VNRCHRRFIAVTVAAVAAILLLPLLVETAGAYVRACNIMLHIRTGYIMKPSQTFSAECKNGSRTSLLGVVQRQTGVMWALGGLVEFVDSVHVPDHLL
jgi:hypothetical protein